MEFNTNHSHKHMMTFGYSFTLMLCCLMLLTGCSNDDSMYDCKDYFIERYGVYTDVTLNNLKGSEYVEAAACRKNNLIIYTADGEQGTLYCFDIKKLRLRWKREITSNQVSVHPYIMILGKDRIVKISDNGEDVGEMKGCFKKCIISNKYTIGVGKDSIYYTHPDWSEAKVLKQIEDEYLDYEVSALIESDRTIIVMHKIMNRVLNYKIMYFDRWLHLSWETVGELACMNMEYDVINEMRIEDEPWDWGKATDFHKICPTINICNNNVVIAFGAQYCVYEIEHGNTEGIREIDGDLIIVTMSSAGFITFKKAGETCYVISHYNGKCIKLPFDSPRIYNCDERSVTGTIQTRGFPFSYTYYYRSGGIRGPMITNEYTGYVLITDYYAISQGYCYVTIVHLEKAR